ncbi:MAG: hypothetical protein M3Q89_00505 [Verrucomicrobiota bacterium]|nr:hypothetical protein [Verrucomicrobiota bacterium]
MNTLEERPPSELAADEILICKICLAGPAPVESSEILGPGERERAAGFHLPADQIRYVQAHVALRRILGALVGSPPAALTFSTNNWGKPALVQVPGPCLLHFNLAHARDLALVALTRLAPLGVDLEWIDASLTAFEKLREFVPAAPSFAGSISEQRLAFYRSWVGGEAMAKADGRGLSALPAAGDYRTFDFTPENGYVACVALPKAASSKAHLRFLDRDDASWPFLSAYCAPLSRSAETHAFFAP